jgi:tRNA A37 threonylcarbamoyladenosine biosynthesis protein TsaE
MGQAARGTVSFGAVVCLIGDAGLGKTRLYPLRILSVNA